MSAVAFILLPFIASIEKIVFPVGGFACTFGRYRERSRRDQDEHPTIPQAVFCQCSNDCVFHLPRSLEIANGHYPIINPNLSA